MWVRGPGPSPPPGIQEGVMGMAEVEGRLEGSHAANITLQALAEMLVKSVPSSHKNILECIIKIRNRTPSLSNKLIRCVITLFWVCAS